MRPETPTPTPLAQHSPEDGKAASAGRVRGGKDREKTGRMKTEGKGEGGGGGRRREAAQVEGWAGEGDEKEHHCKQTEMWGVAGAQFGQAAGQTPVMTVMTLLFPLQPQCPG